MKLIIQIIVYNMSRIKSLVTCFTYDLPVFGSAFLSVIPEKLFDNFFESATSAAPFLRSKIY
jgi:hypothetical protein